MTTTGDDLAKQERDERLRKFREQEEGWSNTRGESLLKLRAGAALGEDARRYTEMPTPPAPGVSENDLKTILTLYSTNPWVYAPVNRIASAVSSVPRNYFRVVDGQKKKVSDTHLQKLLEKPNPWQTFEDLIELTVIDLRLLGWSWWEKGFKEGNTDPDRPDAVWRLRPDRTKIIRNAETYWEGIEFQRDPTSKAIKLPPPELVPFRHWSPLSDYWGISGLFAAQTSVVWDLFARAWNKSFFRNGASTVSDGVFQTDSYLNDATYKRLITTLKNRRGTPDTWQNPLILDNGLKFLPHAQTARDMQFSELMERAREEILAALGVPPAMVGLPISGGLGGYREQRMQFYQITVVPVLIKLQSSINRNLGPEDEIFEFDLRSILSLVEDLDAIAANADRLVGRGILTQNDIRKDMGIEPVGWGDDWWAPLGLAPTGAVGRPERPPGLKREGDDNGEEKAASDEGDWSEKEELADYAIRRTMIKAGQKNVRQKMERMLAGSYRVAFDRVLQEINALLDQNLRRTEKMAKEAAEAMAKQAGDEPPAPPPPPKFHVLGNVAPSEEEIAQIMEEELGDRLLQETNRAARSAAVSLGVDFKEMGLDDPAFQRSFNSWREERIASTARTMTARVNESVQDLQRRGVSPAQASRELASNFERFVEERVGDLARSDATTFSNTAVRGQGEQRGDLTHKQWANSGGPNVRDKAGGETHRPEKFPSGPIVRIDEDFVVPGRGVNYRMDGPGDPRGGAEVTSKCECHLLLMTEPEARALGWTG